jgi:hypothetical protein
MPLRANAQTGQQETHQLGFPQPNLELEDLFAHLQRLTIKFLRGPLTELDPAAVPHTVT